MAGASGGRSLEETPTWAVAAVCAVFVILSILIEHGIHSLGKWFQKRHKKAMNEALEKIKAELMILGFISLLLTVGTSFIARICVDKKLGHIMLPCKSYHYFHDKGGSENDRRKLLSLPDHVVWHRALAAASGSDDEYCSSKGKESLISQAGVHQLHIFIFILAVFHVAYSVMTMALAQAKMKKWKSWELETSTPEYEFSNDSARFRFAHQTSFVRRHSGMSTAPGIRWIVAFFRQFFGSVTKVDYLTIRNGFINAHLAPSSKFNFRNYIKRCMEDDFKVVVGISIPLWVFAIVFLLLNVYKWYTFTWLTVVPLVILLLVGTKLELVIMEMAEEIQEKTTIIRGAPVVEPNNKYFWFNRPQWILLLIHYTLFQNAFQLAYFLWSMYVFGYKSCFHENKASILSRVIIGLLLQFMCSYITFPLYSLVTQMGSHMKNAIFEEQTAKALKKWHQAAKQRKKLKSSSEMMSGEGTPSQGTSPMHLLHNHKYRSSQAEIESVLSSPTPSHLSDAEISAFEASSQYTHHNSVTIHDSLQSPQHDGNVGVNEFSFVKASNH